MVVVTYGLSNKISYTAAALGIKLTSCGRPNFSTRQGKKIKSVVEQNVF